MECVASGIGTVIALAVATWLVVCATFIPESFLHSLDGSVMAYKTWSEQPWEVRAVVAAGVFLACSSQIPTGGPTSLGEFALTYLACSAVLCGGGYALAWAVVMPVRVVCVAMWYQKRLRLREEGRKAREAQAVREREMRRREEEAKRRHEQDEKRREADARRQHEQSLADARARAAREEAERQREARLRAEAEVAAAGVRREAEERRRREAEAERERKRAWDAAPKDRRCTHCGLRYPVENAAACIRCGRSDGQEVVLAGG